MPKQPAKPTQLLLPPVPKKLTWVATKLPTVAALRKDPVGTAYSFKECAASYHVRAKVAPNRWIQATGRTVAQAVLEWREYSIAPPRGTGYFVEDEYVLRWLSHDPDEQKAAEKTLKKLAAQK